MARSLSYIHETSNKHKIRVFLISTIIFIVVLGSILAVTSTWIGVSVEGTYVGSIKDTFVEEIATLSPTGLFYLGFGGGLFFIPLPQELFFYYGLLEGNPVFLSFFMVIAGYLLSQVVNYIVGSKLSIFFLQGISKKKIYKVRRFVNRHGGKGVFLFNLLPLPSPLLTFALGITRYNIYRLYFYTILGTILKYAAIIGFFMLIY